MDGLLRRAVIFSVALDAQAIFHVNWNKVKAFTQTAGASEAAQKGGVIGRPEGWWLTEKEMILKEAD